ncbi:MAG TPA: GGDEF domain-containing phosphodiesterase, partial [Halomonas sp.]|nr:GGDEF domain-containing phosphodiesterase [Halomonas sp.]
DDHPALSQRVGRQAAWKIMRQVARRIGQTFRGEDSVARLGAARWGVLIEHPVSPQSLQVAALRCQEVMDAPFEAAGRPLLLTTSIGIARYPEDGENDEEVMACAERALGLATRSGPGGYDFFDTRLRPGLEAEQDFRRELQEALLAPSQHFHVVYQPVVEPRSGQWQTLEALVRWEHPRRGLLYPRDFLPDAAAMGQLIRLDRWVLERVILQHRQWHEDGSLLATKGVSVNLAATMLDQRVFDGRPLDQFLRAQGQDLSWLSLEFEVSALIARGPAHRHLLERLKQLSITLVVDDVGTQPIDLVQLAMLPFHRAKVGRGLVAGIGKQRHVEQTLAALRECLAALEIEATLVGVETSHQRDMALAMGYDLMQGNLFSLPLAEGELSDWAQANPGG